MSKKIIIVAVVIVVLVLVGIFGYWQLSQAPQKPAPLSQELSPVLNIYNWEDYIGTTTIADFEKEFGVKVNLESYPNEDAMISGVQSDPIKYDIVVGSDILVKEMNNMKLLAEIDLKNIPNLKNIGAEFQNPSYDPGNKHSIPYMWGTSGIVINHEFIEETEPSWAILWSPAYKGKITMLDNMQDVIGAALRYAGYSANSVDPAELEKARQLLLQQKPLLRGYENGYQIRDAILNGELWAAHSYSGDGSMLVSQNENIEYVIPKEGAFIWVDNLLIPVGSQHKYTAEVFINYVLRPDVSAKIANYLWYANTNEAARELTNPDILQDPAIYPSEEARKKLEFAGYFGGVEAVALYNQIWAELQATK
ncbi:MAG: spermidine/putrescine ABC transporter substrate-binding protein [Patescibacteria group bacterium]